MIRLDGQAIDRVHKLEVGDVLMVAMELNDKHKKGKKFTWRFFGVIVKLNARRRYQAQVLVLDGEEREPMELHFMREGTIVHYLAPEEWPDGVHAFRTKAILAGKVDAIF